LEIILYCAIIVVLTPVIGAYTQRERRSNGIDLVIYRG
jgi:hypothetical protein